jgi:predicted Rossmann fold nucleotide-binding protein DprA/Smf involved in DNA uptake
MRTIIAGTRDCTKRSYLDAALKQCGWKPSVVICGCARGADTLGKEWALENKVPVEYFPAGWEKYGGAAGPIRNTQMARVADALIALWDGESQGTLNMIRQMKSMGKKVFVYEYVRKTSR